jgi:hypothetical protein
MMKAFKNITLTLLISSALACGGLAQSGDQWAPQKDKKKERPVEKKKEDRGGDKKDDGGKKGKKPEEI